ncbi:GntR family transcriptional regulator [Ensifer sp. NM-2]|uniref:GntR family transcriptional regulator n=1 Tax=Ensifer sp. NM-2 TaxID=2109730 RepID=UPI000D121471|nr:GntR family transcriptional regulator [Ensifer sp. NM-2]PSS60520.1 GntR family transcriptional regulator [Ensifer sp. NM-2]
MSAETYLDHVDGTDLLSDRVANAVKEEILSGRLFPGSRIRQEELARRFEVSRIPVREALRQLESDGLVTLRPNSGAWVSRIDHEELVEIYKIRERLEPLALRESIPNLSSTHIDRLEELSDKMRQPLSTEAFLKMDRDFHLMTYAGSEAKNLSEMIERFWNTTQHYRRLFTQEAQESTRWAAHAEHCLLVDAIKRMDLEVGERILVGHIARTGAALSIPPSRAD